jgi:hypothetical protein
VKGTIIQHELPSGGKIKVTISEGGLVMIEGATGVNAIYGFQRCGLSRQKGVGSDRIVVHTTQDSVGITAEISVDIDGRQQWWGPLQRPTIRLLTVEPVGGEQPYCQVQVREPDGRNFENVGAVLPMPTRD